MIWMATSQIWWACLKQVVFITSFIGAKHGATSVPSCSRKRSRQGFTSIGFQNVHVLYCDNEDRFTALDWERFMWIQKESKRVKFKPETVYNTRT